MNLHRVVNCALALSLIPALGVAQGPKQTQGTYSTWDADMINSEAVSQTGAGVYVAVLDTGLVPNWKDYFPTERIATNLGTGFYQNVSFKAQNDTCGLGVSVGAVAPDRIYWIQ